MDFFGVGRLGKQPQGEVLLDHEDWPETIGSGDRELERISGVIGRVLRLGSQY